MVAPDRGHAGRAQPGDRLVRSIPVPDDVSGACDLVAPEPLDPGERIIERGHVGVDVGDHGESVGHHSGPWIITRTAAGRAGHDESERETRSGRSQHVSAGNNESLTLGGTTL